MLKVLLQKARNASHKLSKLVKTRSPAFSIASSDLFREKPITYVDVGSCGGLPVRWSPYAEKGLIKVFAFDLADDWSEAGEPTHPHVRTIRAALGETDGPGKVYVARYPACSSCREPNEKILRHYPVRSWFETMAVEDITLRSFKSIARQYDLPSIDIVKIDAQGTELEILKGFGCLLDTVSCVELECHLLELYSGQALFSELYDYMSARGFRLKDLRPQGPFEREAVEFNGFWFRPSPEPRQQSIYDFWCEANSLWAGEAFDGKLDLRERTKFKFND